MKYWNRAALVFCLTALLSGCNSGSADEQLTLESLNQALSQLQTRVAELERKVPANLATDLQGSWAAFEFNMTSGSGGTQAQIVIDANSNFTVSVLVGGPLQSLPCISGTISSETNINAQMTVSYNCGAQGTGDLFVLDSRENGLLLFDIDDNVILRLVGATS